MSPNFLMLRIYSLKTQSKQYFPENSNITNIIDSVGLFDPSRDDRDTWLNYLSDIQDDKICNINLKQTGIKARVLTLLIGKNYRIELNDILGIYQELMFMDLINPKLIEIILPRERQYHKHH